MQQVEANILHRALYKVDVFMWAFWSFHHVTLGLLWIYACMFRFYTKC